MYVLVYQELEHNSITYQKALLYNSWKDASAMIAEEYRQKLDDVPYVWHAIYSVSATIKDENGITYDWSILTV